MAQEDSESFAPSWWKWWDGLNPEWRPRKDGRPVQGGTGDWSSMLKPGPNGFLTIIGSLAALRAVSIDGWRAALSDVEWVLERVVEAKQGPRYVCGPRAYDMILI